MSAARLISMNNGGVKPVCVDGDGDGDGNDVAVVMGGVASAV